MTPRRDARCVIRVACDQTATSVMCKVLLSWISHIGPGKKGALGLGDGPEHAFSLLLVCGCAPCMQDVQCPLACAHVRVVNRLLPSVILALRPSGIGEYCCEAFDQSRVPLHLAVVGSSRRRSASIAGLHR